MAMRDAGREAAYRLLATRRVETSAPEVTRTWGRNRVRVEARHPQYGLLLRGWVVMAGSEGRRMRWTLVDYDHADIGEPIVGNYLDAERALLAATRELEN